LLIAAVVCAATSIGTAEWTAYLPLALRLFEMTRSFELYFHLLPTATFKVILIQQVLVQFSQFVNRMFGKAFGPGAREIVKTRGNYTPEAEIEEPRCLFLSRQMCAFQPKKESSRNL
jgi:hypothetical protein